MENTHAQATQQARERLMAGLDTDFARLRRFDAVRRIAEIVLFAALWAASIALGLWAATRGDWTEWPARMVAVAGAAVAINAFYLVSHEGHHRLLFRRPGANYLGTFLICVPLLHGPSAYRVLHELHHRFLGGPGDPDEYRNMTSNPRVIWLMQWVRLTLGTLVYMPLIPIVAFRRAERRDRWLIVAEYTIMGATWIAVFSVVPMSTLLQVWLVPGVLVGYFSAVRAISQHALTDRDDPTLASRSVRCNALVSFLMLNENYHLEHHLFPEIPSYHLPRLRVLLAPRLPKVVEGPSYTRFLLGFIVRFVRGDDSVLGLNERAPTMGAVPN